MNHSLKGRARGTDPTCPTVFRLGKELGTVMPPKPKPYSPSFTSDEEFLPGREDFADDLTEVLHVDA